MSLASEVEQTLAAFRAGAGSEYGPTVADIMKVAGWDTTAGFQAYNLEKPAKMMFPVLTPVRNITPRNAGSGKQVEYKAVTGINTAGLQGWVAEKTAASITTTGTTDLTQPYKSLAIADSVSFESVWAGRTFMDLKALAVSNLLRAMMVLEENAILFGQNATSAANQQSPGDPTCPAPIVAAAGTDGSFAATTYYVFTTLVTGMGESLPSASTSVAASATNHLTVTPVFPKTGGVVNQPAFGFNIYVATSNSAAAAHKTVSTDLSAAAPSSATVAGVTILTNGQAVQINTIPTGAAPPAASTASSSLAYNGLLTQCFGAVGSGIGPTIQQFNGALTVAGLDTMLLNAWNAANADPNMVLVNAQESVKLTNLTFGAGSPYFVVPEGEQRAGVAGYRASRYINKVTGSDVPVKVHPKMPQGFMAFLSSEMPSWYVPSEIPAVWDLSLPQDYIEIDYPPTSSAAYWQVEVRLYGSLRMYLPLIQAFAMGINNS